MLAGGCVEPDDDARRKPLREGEDFTNADELRTLVGNKPRRMKRRATGERLAEAIAEEVRWLQLVGVAPCGLPWDRQPAWRVRLWNHLIDEQARVAAVKRVLTEW